MSYAKKTNKLGDFDALEYIEVKVRIFKNLKCYRSMNFKDRKSYVVRIPQIFVNGFGSPKEVSIMPASCPELGENFILLGLTEAEKSKPSKDEE